MPAGAVPLGVIVTSDEQEETITTGLKYLSSILPNNAFFGEGPQLGPSLAMIDDSSAERNAITSVWNSTTTLLCTFHFLQRCGTWLHDSNNGVLVKEHRIILINNFKDLVYAEKEEQLTHLYSSLQKLPLVQKYPTFLSHLMSLWPCRRQWSYCYRKRLMLRGNHTNNYSEAGMKILKELIFSRVKAYNLVQVFHFLTDTLESYHCRKLISVSNNRLDSYIALKFKGLHAAKISKECIQETECKNVYIVQSKTDRTMSYTLDMIVGVCTCPQGIDGSPCSHQAAVSIHYGRASINCIPTISPKVRQIYAQIALGDKASTNISFYGSLHSNVSNCEDTDMFHADFNSPSFDLIRAGARDDSINAKVSESQSEDYRQRAQNACLQNSTIANDLKEKTRGNN